MPAPNSLMATLRPVISYDGAQLFALSDELPPLGLPHEALALSGADALLGELLAGVSAP